MKPIVKLIASLCLILPGSLLAQSDEPLMPEQAFPASIENVDQETISITWKIADEYYLYRSKFKFISDNPGIVLAEHESPPGKIKKDEFFGEVETYRGDITVKVPYTRSNDSVSQFTLTVTSQGCADLGICYPPHRQKLAVELPDGTTTKTAGINPIAALSKIGQSLDISQEDDEFLDPEQAFQLIISTNPDGSNQLNWMIADGYYLYKDKVKLSLTRDIEGISLGQPNMPKAKIKEDEYFGKVPVYYKKLGFPVPINNSTGKDQNVGLKISYQGCADAGLCYPPINKTFDITVIAGASATVSSTAPPASEPLAAQAGGKPLAEQDKLAQMLLEKPLWLALIIFYVAGLGLAFTPCVFPMIPILSGIIVGHGEKTSTSKALGLSLAYVLAMALTYTVAGVIAGLAGANLQAAFQNVWVVSTFAAVFVALSFSMFGFYELQMPSAIQSRLTTISNSQRGGSLLSAGIMGFLSALIVGPCVTAPLIGALIVIGQTGDAVLGGSALFALSMGMGTPLLFIGASAGKLLPRAGAWMDTIKAVFGIGLLAIAIWLIERVIPGPVGLFLWAILFIVSAIYMGALDTLQAGVSGWRRLWKGLGLVLLIWGVLMVIGASTGTRDMLNPLKNLGSSAGTGGTDQQAHLNFTRIKTIADFERELASANSRGQPVMLDFYADWCVYCVQMEERTFPDPGVQKALANVHLLQADVTANDDDDKAILKRFGLIAPPSILFFGTDGKEIKSHRLVGFKGPTEFKRHISEALN